MGKKSAKKSSKGGGKKRVTGKAGEIVGPFREGAPVEIDGLRVIGETGDGAAWVCDKGDGTVYHSLKSH